MGQGNRDSISSRHGLAMLTTLQPIYISAELSAPARQLPLAINTSLPSIIICFITANAAYYILLPWDVVSATDSVAVVSPLRCAFIVTPIVNEFA